MISRSERAAALERWADRVEPQMLRTADPEALRVIALPASERDRTSRDPAASVGVRERSELP